jgi:hypothetical protein
MWSVVWFLAHVYRENSVERGEPTLCAINQHESFQCILSPLKHFLRTSHEVPHPKSVTTYKSSTFKSEVLMECAIKKMHLANTTYKLSSNHIIPYLHSSGSLLIQKDGSCSTLYKLFKKWFSSPSNINFNINRVTLCYECEGRDWGPAKAQKKR